MLILVILLLAPVAGAAWAGMLRGRFRYPEVLRTTTAHFWRNNAESLLAAYVLLGLAASAAAVVARPALSCSASAKCWVPYNDQFFWVPIMAFLAGRVSSGGRISRIGLIGWSALGYTAVATTIARVWSLPALSLLAIDAIQIALLTSPAVYQRTRRDHHADLPSPDAQRARPPAWLISTGLLAGLVVTLLYLGNMHVTALPDCGPSRTMARQPPQRCIELAEGYPLPYLSAYQNTPRIEKGALAKDWAQWSLVSFSALYALWLRRNPGSPLLQPSQIDPGQQLIPQ